MNRSHVPSITILFTILLILVFHLNVYTVNASEIEVICTDIHGCSIQPPDAPPFFNVINCIPGESYSGIITVRNYANERICNLILTVTNELQTVQAFDKKLFTVITSNDIDIFGQRHNENSASSNKSFHDLLMDNPISLGEILSGNTRQYDWIATFDPDSGNDYQSARLSFDFNLIFSCDDRAYPIEGVVAGRAVGETLPIHLEQTRDIEGIQTDIFGDEKTPRTAEQEDDILGIKEYLQNDNCLFPWWLPLLLQAILSLLITRLFILKKIAPVRYLVLPLLILGILSQIAHMIIGCCSTNEDFWCNRYWLINGGIVLVSLFLRYLFVHAIKPRASGI